MRAQPAQELRQHHPSTGARAFWQLAEESRPDRPLASSEDRDKQQGEQRHYRNRWQGVKHTRHLAYACIDQPTRTAPAVTSNLGLVKQQHILLSNQPS